MALNNSTVYIPSPKFEEINAPLYITLYAILTVMAIVGNIVVVVTIALSAHMRSKTFMLLLNLAISDLVFALISPVHVYPLLNPGKWLLDHLGDFGCSLYYFLMRSLYAFSVLILVVITCDRFIAIIFPLKPKSNVPYPSLTIVTITYLVSFASSAPLLKSVILVQSGPFSACSNSNWDSWQAMKIYYGVIYTSLFIIPFLLMVVLYSIMWVAVRKPPPGMTSNTERRMLRKRRLAYMMMSVVTGFFLSWTPWTILEALVLLSFSEETGENTIEITSSQIAYTTLTIFASGAMNPILYGFLLEEFRSSVAAVFCGRIPNRVWPMTASRRYPSTSRGNPSFTLDRPGRKHEASRASVAPPHTPVGGCSVLS